MAETLGSLCDKLSIVKLKQYHTDDASKLTSLSMQAQQLQEEIDCYISDALLGNIPLHRLTFSANKVYKKAGNETKAIEGTIGFIFAELAKVNCELWHEQEKVYDFENVTVEEKDTVVKRLAILNLERNHCIDAIDSGFKDLVREHQR